MFNKQYSVYIRAVFIVGMGVGIIEFTVALFSIWYVWHSFFSSLLGF